jgi:DnaJ domain
LITDLSKAYELLGVKPGVSSRELKAAHRDLAKVWHPDRFVHDPRLQEKAQEKLKEINEAYELISSGKTPRSAPPRETAYAQETRRSTPRGGGVKWPVIPVLLFAAVFVVTTKVLLERRSHAPVQPEVETVQVEPATQTEPGPRSEVTRKPSRNDQPAPEENSASIDAPAPTPALATVTVLIDPESGLLAKADCPVRSRMTYPSGSQPSAYCTLNHTPPPKESRLKSIKEKILH